MARNAGFPVERVVKHYGSPDTPLHPSLIAKHEAIPRLIRERRAFTMESDFMDENSQAGGGDRSEISTPVYSTSC